MSFQSLALSALCLAIPVMSQALTLDCQINSTASGGGYVTDRYIFQVRDGTNEAIVSDGLILYYNDKQPLAAIVSEDTAKKLVLTWKLQMTDNVGQQANMQFRAAYFKADGSVIIRAVPGAGYSNTFEDRGRCKTL